MPSVPVRSERVPPRSTDGAPLGRPLFVLNLKTFPGVLGAGADRIGRLLADEGRAAGVSVAIAPAFPDVGRLATNLPIPVLSQHVDPLDPGAHTGFVPVEAVRAAGARGSLVNHSEHPISSAEVRDAVRRLTAVGLAAIVCARDVAAARRLARVHPAYLAVEPPELIGGDRAVSTARPEVVSGTVEAVRTVAPGTITLCGAGVHDRRDVRRALELGAGGVLVASAVTRASDTKGAIRELLAGF
jgi:triosephosphate isomerase (TIM)